MKKRDNSTICVLGAGYVGLTTAAIFANSGFKVYLIEPNKTRLKTIESGKSFFYEQGLDPLLAKAIDGQTLIPTDSYEEVVPRSDIIFSCVGTPDNPDGSSNLSYVYSAAKESAKYITNKEVIYVQKSTVPVGTGKQVQKIFQGKQVRYVSNPEFLREGTAISDSLFFDRVVAGSDNLEAARKILGHYKKIEQNRPNIAKLSKINTKENNGQYIDTNLNSAELIKVTSNAFLALKISFANSIAKLADQTGADVVEVMDAVGADKRIGRAFLNAGRGYGGGCFPKDVSGLISSASEYGVDLNIMTAAADLNETMPGYIANKAQEALGGDLKNKKLAVLGLAFKSGTSDTRRSPGIKLANILSKNGALVSVYDPRANGEAKDDLRKSIKITDSIDGASKDADAIFITTNWPEFIDLDLAKLKKLMDGDIFVDTMNCTNPNKARSAGLNYVGIGR